MGNTGIKYTLIKICSFWILQSLMPETHILGTAKENAIFNPYRICMLTYFLST